MLRSKDQQEETGRNAEKRYETEKAVVPGGGVGAVLAAAWMGLSQCCVTYSCSHRGNGTWAVCLCSGSGWPGICVLGPSLERPQPAGGNSWEIAAGSAAALGMSSCIFCPLRNCLLKKAHFSCLLGVPVCHFYKSVFIGLIIVNAEPNKGDCDCNIW